MTEQAEESKQLKMDDVVKAYMLLRQKKEEIERETKERVEGLKTKMDKIEAFLLQKMQEIGATSFKTPHGTVYTTSNDFANVADWQAVLEYAIANEAFDLFEKRVNKSAVKAHLEETGSPPPGVNYGQRLDVSIRKPTRKD